jgi:hypothetical protein
MDRHSTLSVKRVAVCFGTLLLLLAALQQSTSASILPLPSNNPSTWSDITASMIGNYGITTTDVFTVNGMSQATFFKSLLTGFSQALPANSFLKILNLKIVDGVVTSNGALTITLPSPAGPYPSGLLLSGSVDAIQFVAQGKLEIGFNVTGGSAANDFGGLNAMAGIRLSMTQAMGTGGSATTFGSTFSFGGGGGAADLIGAPVPEPVSFLVFAGLALSTAGVTARRRDL